MPKEPGNQPLEVLLPIHSLSVGECEHNLPQNGGYTKFDRIKNTKIVNFHVTAELRRLFVSSKSV